MQTPRRDLLKLAGGGIAASLMTAGTIHAADSSPLAATHQVGSGIYDLRRFGAAGDGTTIDTPAVNKAIDAAASAGGGVVHLSAGTYACYSIHLKSYVTLFLDRAPPFWPRLHLPMEVPAATIHPNPISPGMHTRTTGIRIGTTA